jgi:hypothetical protein
MTLSRTRRAAAVLAAALIGFGLSTLFAGPAAAAGVGYVRLAHLSPDTPAVDVYLTAVSGTPAPQKFDAVGYGVMSNYLPLPAGTYSVAMRNVGAPASSPPVLSTQVTVSEGGAYTVAGVGKFADLGLRVINDDISLPTGGMSKVRVIQASIRAPLLDVSVAGGSTIANGVAFATTTAYQQVTPGRWNLRLQPAGSANATTVGCTLAAGGVYSVLVLDGKNGLTIQVRTDARAGSQVPEGGVNTGAGGTSRERAPYPLLLAASLGVLFAAALAALRVRRLRRVHRRL